ncbi:hypothetical protein D3C87_1953000 [compost metagenome]
MAEGDGDRVDLLPDTRLARRFHFRQFGRHFGQQPDAGQELFMVFDADDVGHLGGTDVG